MAFSWSVDEERYHGDFATIEEAIADAEAEQIDEGEEVGVVYVGEKSEPTQPEVFWGASDWLERVSCQDDYSIDVAEDWDSSTKEQRDELETEVRKVLAAWLDKHKLRPGFWIINKPKKYRRENGKWEKVK